MSDLAEVDALIAAAHVAASKGDSDSALARLLEAAEMDPLDGELHDALGQVCPLIPLVSSEDEREDFTVWTQLWDAFRRNGSRKEYLFELLPEQGRVDESLFRLSSKPDGPERWHRVRLGVPGTLAEHLPLHPESHGGYTTYECPRMTVVDGVLRVDQHSRFAIKPWEISVETMVFTAYRVRGSLFHARWSRFQYYHYRR